MKTYLFIILYVLVCIAAAGQQSLPAGFAPGERGAMPSYLSSIAGQSSGITTPPPFPVRTMAEWEELQALVITWTSYPSTLREIVKYAKEECKVIIVCTDSTQVINYLSAGGVNTVNVEFIISDFNSVWIRDYGGNSVYRNEVDSLILVDWIYNRPRPKDDIIPQKVADHLGVPLYQTTVAPYDLVHTGGNFMSDGFGTAFSSKLVLDENKPGATYSLIPKTEEQVDSIMNQFMGIENYIKMEVLPYDGIHHIDMHMKLLDEETLLVGKYPDGVADGPQIEANLQYVLSNFNSVYGTPYEVVRIQMPPDANGEYPNVWWADYRTYTNSVFVNKTLLVPVYEEQYDSTALRILRESLPGYDVVGINCNQIIQAGGALHCITREVGVYDPLLISHQKLQDQDASLVQYEVRSYVNQRTGIASATIYYTTDTSAGFQNASMMLSNPVTETWTGYIPAQPEGSEVYYYIHAESVSGKQQVRPITAPEGWWKFKVTEVATTVNIIDSEILRVMPVFPNPATGITCLPIKCSTGIRQVKIRLLDILGREVIQLHDGFLKEGDNHFFLNAAYLDAGSYFLTTEHASGISVQKVIVR